MGRAENGRKEAHRTWGKRDQQYPSKGYRYSFHILLPFDSRTVNQLRVCSEKFSKDLETMSMEQGKEEKGRQQRETVRDERGTGNKSISNFSSVFGQVKAFSNQHLAEYRSLLPSEDQPDVGAFSAWHQITPVFEAVLLWAVMILCPLYIIWGCTPMLWTNTSLWGRSTDWCISLIKHSNEIE